MHYFHFALFLSLLCGCQQTENAEEKNQKPLVLVSIAPYKFLTQKLGGNCIEVQTITPQTANPHTFEPTSRQVIEISRGEIWFCIGEPFEKKVLPLLLDRNPALITYDLREGIELQPDLEENTCMHDSLDLLDRHVWLSPKLMGLQAETIAKILSGRFPMHALEFQENLNHCLKDLETLDLEIRTLLNPLLNKCFIVSHPAFGYFCHDYGLEQLSIEQEGKEPRSRHVEEVLKKAKRHPIDIALALPQHNNKGARLIATHLKVPLKMIDPYSIDYFTMMRDLAHILADPHYDPLPNTSGKRGQL